nr:retrovirus-related Pol polyprotein from transposon TNT 1-94 [Tanacetum cinerariifolium]
EPASPLRDVSKGEACPTDSGFRADQARANIAKTSTLPHDSAPRVTSPTVDVGSMQQTFNELTALCTSLQRQHSELVSKFEAQELEINMLKARVKLLEDREGGGAERSGDDALIKGRILDEGEAAAERVSDDTKEMATVLTSMDAATVLASGVAEVPTGSGSIPTASPPAAEVPTSSGSIPTAGPPAAEVPTSSDVFPTAGPIFATATMVTPYTRRKGKETMVESETPNKKKVAKDAKIARIHAKEELQIMIDGLDRSNETTFQQKNKGLVAEIFDWDVEEVSEDEDVTQVKVLMALADDELTVGKSHAQNDEWVDITIRKVNTLLSMDEDVDWKNYLKYINIDLKFVEEQRLNLLSKYNKIVFELNKCRDELLSLKQSKLDAVTF